MSTRFPAVFWPLLCCCCSIRMTQLGWFSTISQLLTLHQNGRLLRGVRRLIHPAEADRVTVNQVTVSHECWRVFDMVGKSGKQWRPCLMTDPVKNFVFARTHSRWCLKSSNECLESLPWSQKGRGWGERTGVSVCSATESHVWPNNRLTAHQRLFLPQNFTLK